MMTFKDEWEATLDDLETEIANLLVCFVVASSISTKFNSKAYLSFKKNLQISTFLFSLLKEQLNGAGVELPKLYKLIESQAPNGCYTEAWQQRAHWVGTQVTKETEESVANAKEFLDTHRPVRK